MEFNKIFCGDVLQKLRELPNECVDCVVTSPPYWGLRDYGTASWEGGSPDCDHKMGRFERGGLSEKQATNSGSNGDEARKACNKCGAVRVDSQIGLEATPEEYVGKLVEVFREVRRVLKKEGTLWLNLGDSYAGSNKGSDGKGGFSVKSEIQLGNEGSFVQPMGVPKGLKPKDLVGIPWRVAFALQADGWFLRQDIVWSKPNPMPESVTDRCTKCHEYIFLLTKSSRYFFDNEAIKERSISEGSVHVHKDGNKMSGVDGNKLFATKPQRNMVTGSFRNKRSVWTVTTKPFRGAHFATFPEDLIMPAILAGTSEVGCCEKCGKPYERQIENNTIHRTELPSNDPRYRPQKYESRCKDIAPDSRKNDAHTIVMKKTIGWQPSCECNAGVVPCVVLDPFFGSGTVGVVCKRLRRDWVGIELNPEYADMAMKRIAGLKDFGVLKDIKDGKQMELV